MIATDLHGLLRTRRSIRRFRAEPVPDAVIERILTSAIHAPSAHNRQPWRFRVINSTIIKACLASAMGADFRRDLTNDGVAADQVEAQVERSYNRITGAPVVILLCMDTSDMDDYPDATRAAAERTMAVQSVAAAGAQLLLASHAEGLGAVWVCSPLFAPQTVQRALELPSEWEPQAMYFLGYPGDEPRLKTLKALRDMVIFDEG